MTDTVDFLYKCSDFYTPGDEYGTRLPRAINEPVLWRSPPGMYFTEPAP